MRPDYSANVISTSYPPRGPDHGGGTSRKAWRTQLRRAAGLMTIACDSKVSYDNGFAITCGERLDLPGASTAEQARERARQQGWARQEVDGRLRDHCPFHVEPEGLRSPPEPS